MDCSPPGSSVHGDFPQTRTLEWSLSFSRGASLPKQRTLSSPRLLHWQMDSLSLGSPGKPQNNNNVLKDGYTTQLWHRSRKHVCKVQRLLGSFQNHRATLAPFVVQSLGRVRLFATPWTAAPSGFPVLHYLPQFAQIHVHLSLWCYLTNSSSAALFSNSLLQQHMDSPSLYHPIQFRTKALPPESHP